MANNLKPFSGELDSAPAGLKPFSGALDGDKATALDYAKGLGSGLGKLVSGIGYLGERVGLDQAGKAVRDIGDTTSKYWADAMTPAGQRAAQSQVFEDDPNSVLPKLGERWGQALGMGTAQSLPSMAASAVPGGIAANVLTRGAGALAARGIGGATTALAGGTAAPVGTLLTNTAGQVAARAPSAIGMGASEGLTAGAMNAADMKSQIEATPEADLLKSPAYAALRAQHDAGTARSMLAEQASGQVFGQTTLSTGGIGAITGGGALGSMYRNMTGVTRDSLLKATAKGAGGEAMQEFPQSGGERLISNVATRDYLDPNQRIGEGVVSDALSGAAVGGLTGGLFGAGGAIGSPPEKPAGVLAKTVAAGEQSGAVQPIAGALPNYPVETQIVFPDGSTGTRKQFDDYLAGLPEDQRSDAMARMLNMGAQPARTPDDIAQAKAKADEANQSAARRAAQLAQEESGGAGGIGDLTKPAAAKKPALTAEQMEANRLAIEQEKAQGELPGRAVRTEQASKAEVAPAQSAPQPTKESDHGQGQETQVLTAAAGGVSSSPAVQRTDKPKEGKNVGQSGQTTEALAQGGEKGRAVVAGGVAPAPDTADRGDARANVGASAGGPGRGSGSAVAVGDASPKGIGDLTSAPKPRAGADSALLAKYEAAKVAGDNDAMRRLAHEINTQKAAPQQKPEKPAAKAKGLTIGAAPGSAEPITVRNGVVHVGEYPAQDFESGADVTVPDGASGRQIREALKAAGAIPRGHKIYGLQAEQDAAQPEQNTAKAEQNAPAEPEAPATVSATPPSAVSAGAPTSTKGQTDGTQAAQAEQSQQTKASPEAEPGSPATGTAVAASATQEASGNASDGQTGGQRAPETVTTSTPQEAAGEPAKDNPESTPDYGDDTREVGIAVGRIHAALANPGNQSGTGILPASRDAVIEAIEKAKAVGVKVSHRPASQPGYSETWNIVTPSGREYVAQLSPTGRGNWIAATDKDPLTASGIDRARENNTFTGQSSGAGRRVGFTQPKGTPTVNLFANFADDFKGPAKDKRLSRFRDDMFKRASADPRQFVKDDVATSDESFGDGMTVRIEAAKSGRTRVQVFRGGEVIAAARIERGMIDSIATSETAKGKQVGRRLLAYLDAQRIANVDEVPDRSPGFVDAQKAVIDARNQVADRSVGADKESLTVAAPAEAAKVANRAKLESTRAKRADKRPQWAKDANISVGDVTEPSITRRANPGAMGDQSFVARAFLKKGDIPIRGEGATEAEALLAMMNDADRVLADTAPSAVMARAKILADRGVERSQVDQALREYQNGDETLLLDLERISAPAERPAEDLGAMFDDLMGEIGAGAEVPKAANRNKLAETKKTRAEKKPVTPQVPSAAPRTQAAPEVGIAAARSNGSAAFKRGVARVLPTSYAGAPTAEKEAWFSGWDQANAAAPTRTAGQAAASAAKNTADGFQNAISGLGKLFGGNGRLSSGLTFDEQTYQQAKPLFSAAAANFKQAGADLKDVMKAVMLAVREQFGDAVLGNMKPYIVRYVEDVRAGKVNYDGSKEAVGDDRGTEGQGSGALENVPAAEVEGSAGSGPSGLRPDASGDGSGKTDPGAEGQRGKTGRGRGNGPSGNDPAAAGNGRDQSGNAGGTGREGSGVPADLRVEPAHVPLADFEIGSAVALGSGGQMTKYRDNVAAIRILKQMEGERRRATPDEQRTLARYVGWGGIPNAFKNSISGEIKEGWAKEVAELAELLTPAELRSAAASTPNAHYTAQPVVEFMWKLVDHLGFRGGLVLEPSVGTGNFIGLMPQELRGTAHVTGVELDSITARIAGALYPRSNIVQSGFEKLPLPDNQFDLAVGNPPFGRDKLRFTFKPELNGKTIHNQFFRASMDAVKPGGLQIMVVSRFLLDSKNTENRLALAQEAELVGAIRLPGSAFKGNALTEVVTDIIVLQKRSAADAEAMREALNERNRAEPKNETAAERSARLTRRQMLEDAMAWVETRSVRDPNGGDDITINRYFAINPEMIAGALDRTGSMRAQNDVDVKLRPGETIESALDKIIGRFPQRVAQTITEEVSARTEERHKLLGEAMKLSATGAEIGSIRFDDDGSLMRVIERLDDNGDAYIAKVTVDANTPWSAQLAMGADGKWFQMVPKLGADGLPVKAMKNGKPTKRNIYERQVFANDAAIGSGLRLGASKFDRLKKLVGIRDLLVQQLALETTAASKDQMEGNRAKLRGAYEAFVKDHGFISEPKNAGVVADMPDEGLLLSLEMGFKREVTASKAKATGMAAAPSSAKPAAILSRPVGIPPARIDHADTIEDALALTLAATGRLNIDMIAELRGLSVEAVGEELTAGESPLAYQDPEQGRALVDKNEYLSGNVRRKLEAARHAGMAKNVKALEAVQPKAWTSDQVTPKMGSAWIPPETYSQFVQHLLGEGRVLFAPQTNTFDVVAPKDTAASTTTWGTPRARANELISDILNSRRTAVYDSADRDGGPYFNQTETDSANDKRKDIIEAFDGWVFQDADRRKLLTQVFNDKYNTRVNRQHDGSHMTFPGKVPDEIIGLRRGQTNAIWRGIVEPFVLYDHAVGAGKTFTGVARAMERRRMGLSKKPMIVVPNHLVQEWQVQTFRLYPGAKVLAAGVKDLETKNRRRLFAKIASGDWDIVIVPHSSFQFISVSQATEERLLQSELEIANEALKAADAEASQVGGRFKSIGQKQAESLVNKLEARLDKVRERTRDKLLTFEQMGVDDLTIDESHEFKNLQYSTNLTGVRGMGNPTGSAKALDMYMKTRVLHENNGSIAFMTGTPISNSAAEMYTLLRYLAPQMLDEMGLSHFDAFRNNYVDATEKFEPTDSGSGLKPVTRLGRQWSNMRSLMDAYYSVADVVTNEDIKAWYAEDNPGKEFPLPKVKGGDRQPIAVDPTPTQKATLDGIIARFDALPYIDDVKERNAERLRLMDQARKVSLHAKAVDPRLTDEPGGKLDRAVVEIKRLYDKFHAKKGTQLVFLDRGVPKSKADLPLIKAYDAAKKSVAEAMAARDEEALTRATDALEKFDANEIEELRVAQTANWSGYQHIKDGLVAAGVPANEIAFIQDFSTDIDKKALFDSVNDGSVRVLIGSSPRMGAGTNVQERLVGLHHIDVTWKPSDIEQREGRIIRQGNHLAFEDEGKGKPVPGFEVEILAYVTKNTVDAKLWDLNSTKLRMVNAVRYYDGAFEMDFDDESSVGMAEIAAIASGDPLLLERFKLSSEVDVLYRQRRAFQRRQESADDALKSARNAIANNPQRIKSMQASDVRNAELRAMIASKVEGRTLEMMGKKYSHGSISMARMDLADAIARQRGADKEGPVSVTINGKEYTSIDGATEAVSIILGDVDPFVGEVAGKETGRRSDVARAIRETIGAEFKTTEPARASATIAGIPFDVESYHAGWRNYPTVSLTARGGGYSFSVAADVSPENWKEGQPVLLNATNLRPVVEQFASTLQYSYEYQIENLQKAIKDAERDIPALEKTLSETWSHADEMDQKSERLRVVEEELSARADQAAAAKKAEGAAYGPGLYWVTNDKGERENAPRELSADSIGQLLAHGWSIKKAGADDDADMASRQSARQPTIGQAPDTVRAEIAKTIGAGRLTALERKGLVKIHADIRTLPSAAQKYPDAWGWFDGETVHLVAGNLAPGQAAGVFQHEVWHRMLRSLRLDQSPLYGKLMDRLGKIEANGAHPEWFRMARAMVPAEDRGNTARRLNETAAYAIQRYAEDPQSLPALIRRWAADMIAAVRAFFMDKIGFVPKNLTDADLAAITRRYVRALADGENIVGPMVGGAEALTARSNQTETPDISFSRPADAVKSVFQRTKESTSGDTGRYTDEQRAMFKRVGRTTETPSIEARFKAIWKDAGKKIAQGMVDQFRPLRELGGQAYLLARLSKGTEGAIDAFLHHGKLRLNDNVYDADTSGGAIEKVFQPLQGEADDFLWWVASNRAARLSTEDRENLFTPADIAAGRSLADGVTAFDYTLADGTTTRDRTKIYQDALKKFDGFNRNAMDVAEQSGLIDGESRKYWEHEFYVPFYRVNDEEGGFSGAHVKKGLVRQEAFKQLKGGQNKLNADLLENTLQNWAHLIDAAAKNRAARATLAEARKMGIARPARQGEKDSVWYMGEVTRAIPKGTEYEEGGVTKVSDGTATIREHGKVNMVLEGEDAPYIMEAISSLQYAGLGSWAKPLTAVKRWLTIGVTASPAFKIRNLIRDSVQAIGTADLSYNPARNLKEGFQATRRDSQKYVSMLASGALIRFGTMEGEHSQKIRRLVDKGVEASTILDSPNKLKAFYGKYLEPCIDAYNELGNRGEEINRAALYEQLTAKGMGHAEAALLARDLMDFSMQGTWAPIRFLTQVVPFMNARLQGLYKLGRASKEDKRRFATVVGAVALFSTMLMLAYEDDDDWKKREDWDRDNNWWFKIGGVAFRIPKPFEIGTLGTLAERGVELFASDEMTGERFRGRVFHMLSDTLAMNPVPQLFKPVIDLYANKNSFTGRPIETMGMERLLPEYRFTSRTTLAARAVSTAGNAVTGSNFLSPVQVDHLVQGYFSWLGAFTTGTVDRFTRPLTGDPKQPTEDYWRTATAGFLSSLSSQQSRYVSQMYEQARVLEQAHGTYQNLVKSGRREEAIAFRQENADALSKYKVVEHVKKIEAKINQRIRKIENSDLTADQKRNLIDIANRQKDAAARTVMAR